MPKKERFIWTDIIITLLALELMAFFYYGMRALAVAGLCMGVSFACEYCVLKLMEQKFTADNLGCLTDGLLVALMLPVSVGYTIAGTAAVFANVIGRNIFGGRSNMIFSPAAIGYLFAVTSWGEKVLMYPKPFTKLGVWDTAHQLVNSATYTFNHTGEFQVSDYETLMGNFSGPVGAVSILLLIIGAVVLLFRKDLSLGTLIGFFAGLAVMCILSPYDVGSFNTFKYVIATNMTLFTAVFIVSDIRTAPRKIRYGLFYGLFIAMLSYVLLVLTGIENIFVSISVLLTPVALGMRNIERKLEV